MIPFIEWYDIPFGFFNIQVWGLFTVLGFLTGIFLTRWKLSLSSKKNSANTDFIWDLGAWVVLGSLVSARLGHVFFYAWSYYSRHAGEILNIWQGGMSAYGGFIGAAIVFWIFVYAQKINFWSVADAILWAFPFGIMVGRMGCAFIHDHPGKLTNLSFGVQYPGGARFDTGLLEIFAILPLAIAFFILRKKEYKKPVFFCATVLYYGVIRFFLDFLRATDVVFADARYAGLTPAQYGSIVLVVVGLTVLARKKIVSAKE